MFFVMFHHSKNFRDFYEWALKYLITDIHLQKQQFYEQSLSFDSNVSELQQFGLISYMMEEFVSLTMVAMERKKDTFSAIIAMVVKRENTPSKE